MIQINSPSTVATFLQRLGRTGCRPGSARNCLFLTLTPDALVTAAALLVLWDSDTSSPSPPVRSPISPRAREVSLPAVHPGGTVIIRDG